MSGQFTLIEAVAKAETPIHIGDGRTTGIIKVYTTIHSWISNTGFDRLPLKEGFM
ncbi:MAG: hypothetical protein QXN62_08245 [Candidatus Bathyarchaeia archaeon]